MSNPLRLIEPDKKVKLKSGEKAKFLQAFEHGKWKTYGRIVSRITEGGDKIIYYYSERGEEHIYKGRLPTIAEAIAADTASWGIDKNLLPLLQSEGVQDLIFYRKVTDVEFVIPIERFDAAKYEDNHPPFQQQYFVTFSQFEIKRVKKSDRALSAVIFK